jgi:glucose 1-dehydrogenase
MMKNLQGKIALVTGAARGMGRGIALCLAEHGADIAINDLDSAEGAQEVLSAIEERGQRACYWQADVADRAAVSNMISEVTDRFGYLDICVANAAINISEPIVDAIWENVLRTIQVSQFGVFHTCQKAAQQMIRQVKAGRLGGKIIIIGSIHEEMAVPGCAAYNMAKAATVQLGQTLAVELAPFHINVNIIHPGLTDTPASRFGSTDEHIQRVASRIPWERLGMPEDVGKAVAFLASDEADYITGTKIRVDGGYIFERHFPIND